MKRKWFRSNWYWITIIGVAVISFLVYLGWKHGIAISFAVLSILVATFFASRSLKLTQDSLELTRATTRPFLSLTEVIFHPTSLDGEPEFELALCNTGSLPANEVSVELELYQLENKNASETPLAIFKQNLTIFLPNEERRATFSVAPQAADLVAKGREMRLEVRITYRSVDKECKTFRAYRWTTWEKDGLGKITLGIIAGRDYWD